MNTEADVNAALNAESKKAPGTIDLQYLQTLFLQKKQFIEDELERKEIQSKLNAIHKEYKELNSILRSLHPPKKNNVVEKKAKHGKSTATLRKRANPEFGRLGISVPSGQRPGNERVPLGTKIKQERRTRRTRRDSQNKKNRQNSRK